MDEKESVLECVVCDEDRSLLVVDDCDGTRERDPGGCEEPRAIEAPRRMTILRDRRRV